jgi:3-keto-disaccharide hydrolase
MRNKIGSALAGLALAGLGACGGGGDASPPVSADGWQTLFDGSGLEYFSMLGDANWHIEDTSVAADSSTAPSWLVSNQDYSNFELQLEFWVDTEANSGVFLRCRDREAVSDTSCYEVNIFDTRADQTYRTGGIVNVAAPDEFVYTGGQWNRYDITANGNRLQVTLNGRDLVDVEDSQLASGPIALQYGAGTVKFRNVRIRPL